VCGFRNDSRSEFVKILQLLIERDCSSLGRELDYFQPNFVSYGLCALVNSGLFICVDAQCGFVPWGKEICL
jgi:hypothetical protein